MITNNLLTVVERLFCSHAFWGAPKHPEYHVHSSAADIGEQDAACFVCPSWLVWEQVLTIPVRLITKDESTQ